MRAGSSIVDVDLVARCGVQKVAVHREAGDRERGPSGCESGEAEVGDREVEGVERGELLEGGERWQRLEGEIALEAATGGGVASTGTGKIGGAAGIGTSEFLQRRRRWLCFREGND